MEIDKRNYNEINELLKIASFAGRLILENGGGLIEVRIQL